MRKLWVLFCAFITSSAFAVVVQTPQYFVGRGHTFELSLEVVGSKGTLVVTAIESNEPLSNAHITVQSTVFSEDKPKGVYKAELANLEEQPQIIIQTDTDADVIVLQPPTNGVYQPFQDVPTEKIPWFDLKSFGLGALLVMIIFALFKFGRSSSTSTTMVALLLVFTPFILMSPQVSAHEGHDHGEPEVTPETTFTGNGIRLSKHSQVLLGLKTKRVKQEISKNTLKAYGHIIPKPQLDAVIVAPQSGFVRGSDMIYLGKVVKKGELLASIETTQVIHLFSPINGEISESYAVQGSRVESGSKLFRVTDSTVLWVDAEVFSSDLGRIRHMPPEIHVVVEGDSYFKARPLNQISSVNEETRTAKVYIELLPDKNLPKIGSFAEVSFPLSEQTKGFIVPRSAVVNRAGDDVAYVKTAPEVFEERDVVMKATSNPANILVTQGLVEGDLLVIQGSYQLLMKAH